MKDMKGFYDTRSVIVHGGTLKTKHGPLLARVDAIRSYVRRLLRSFVSLAASGDATYKPKFFEEQLDAVLLDETERERLRTALGLVDAGAGM